MALGHEIVVCIAHTFVSFKPFLNRLKPVLVTLSLTIALPLLTVALPAAAAELIIDPNASQQSITAASEFFATDKTLSIDQVRSLPDQQWQPSPGHSFNKGLSPVGYWFRVSLTNASDQLIERLIQLDRPYVDIADIYIMEHHTSLDKKIAEYHLGDWRPNRNKPINQQVIVVPISVRANSSSELYVYFNNHGASAHYIMTLWDSLDFYDNKLVDDIFTHFYFGGALILAMYNLFIFVSLKQVSYAFYSGYILSFTYIVATLLGYPQWAASDAMLHYHQYVFLVTITSLRLFIYLFTISFLKLESRTPFLAKVFKFLIVFETSVGVALFASYAIEDYQLFAKLYAFGGKTYVIHGIASLSAGILLLSKGYKEARFFTIALTIFCLTIIINALSIAGVIAFNKDILRFLQFGQLLEMLLLSFALADKINIARQTEQQLSKTKQQLFDSELQSIKERHKAEKAALSNQAKSAFLSNMSHEIRTPMNAILGFSQLLQMNENIPPEEKKELGIINQSGEYLLSLINDILEMSKIEAGHIKLNPRHFDAYALLQTTEVMLRDRCEKKHLTLSLDQSEDFPQYLYADEGKLKQIMINLLGNAIQFTEQGGIILHASCKMLKEDLQDKNQPQLLIIIEVEDSGVGIAETDFDKVFGSFQQTDSGVKSGEGTGLGLSISREYARLMGGDITFTSQLNQGSIFRLEARCGVGETVEVRGQQTSRRPIGISNDTESAQASYRILIVDDKENNRRLLSGILYPLGFELKEAVDGKQAIEVFETWQPHLILMDERMPVMNGSEATQRINATPVGKNTPIICVSASAFEDDRKRILEQGADEFIRKPLKDTEVLEKIGALLNLRYVYEASDASNEQGYITRE